MASVHWSSRLAAPRRAAVLLLALLFLGAQAAAPAPGEPPREPVLRIEAGGHVAPIARLAVDASGRLLATVSEDKTLRLWSLPDGTATAVLRPPIGPDQEGGLYAVAMAPDGSRIYATGQTGLAWDGAFSIMVFEAESGRILGRFPQIRSRVLHLAVSPDGSRLAAATTATGIQVWDARSGRSLFTDTSYGAAARFVTFAADNRRAVATADGRVRLYGADGRKTAERAPVPNGRPYGLAFSPDGTLLAVGQEAMLRVDLLAAADLRTVFAPDTGGLGGEGLPAVAWSSDGVGGVQLHAAGYATGPTGAYVIRRWADFGLGAAIDLPAARDAISQLVPLTGGGLVYAAADPGWGRMAPDGTLVRRPQPVTADFRNTGSALAVSADGMRVRFQMTPRDPPLLFDAGLGRLDPASGGEMVTPARTTGKLAVTNWRNVTGPRLGRAALRLEAGEISRSLALLPRDDAFVLGTATHLRLFDAAGRLLDEEKMPGEVWGVAVSANNTVVAALGDGTLRWFAITAEARLEERAALFVHADGARWVMWTPEGLFDHGANGGQELVGVHLNNGRAQAAEWATFQQAYRALYAPAELRAALAGDPAPARTRLAELGDVRARIAQLPVLKAGGACAVLTDGSCPPVTLTGNVVTVPPDSVALRLTLRTEDRGLGLGPLDILVNSRLASRGLARTGSFEVPLDPGANTLATRLYAEDQRLFAEGPGYTVRREGERPPPTEAGRLIILAIGVNRYANPELNLGLAVADAEGVANRLRERAGSLFRDVEAISLTDAQATRAGILAALAQVAARARPEDTFVLYMAGHGVRTERDRRFLFLPSDIRDVTTVSGMRAGAIEDEVLVAALARIRARDGFLFLDTCHAGQLTVDSLAALGNETGRFLLAASTSVQEALDSYDDRNGVFAYAVLEALSGRAASDSDGRVSALAIGEYVSRRVTQLAAEKRHSQNAVFRTAGRDLRGFPLAIVRR